MGNQPTLSSSENDEYPWFPIMMWVGETLPSGVVMTYSVADIKMHIFQICQDKPVLIDKLINFSGVAVDFSFFGSVDVVSEDSDVRHDFPLLDIASALLDVVPNLSQIRFSLVPRRLTEEVFWNRFLSLIKDKSMSEGIIKEGLAQVLPIETNEVFYNPAQVFNRDISVFLTSLYVRERTGLLALRRETLTPPFRVLEGLAASGLRSLRYSKELRFAEFAITANDIEPVAAERIRRNIEFNHADGDFPIEVVNADAILHMHQTPSIYTVIDLDPYGSASPFLDAAMGAVLPGGLLCITSTDGGVLCGNQPHLSFARYGGFALKEDYCHEMGLRVLIHSVAAAAGRRRRAIRVLAAFSIDFYFRIFVQVIESPGESLEALSHTGLVFQCVNCPFHQIQPLAIMTGSVPKPARLPLSQCPQCDSPLCVGGPMWTGPIYNGPFIDAAIALSNDPTEFPGISSWNKLKGLLHGLKSELNDIPLFYTIPGLTKSVKCSPPKLATFCYQIEQLGFRVGSSHRVPNSIKTDAPGCVVFDLLRMFAKSSGPKSGGVAEKIMAKPIELVLTDEVDWDAAVPQTKRSVPVYMPNPTPFWGPKPRAKKSRPDEQ